jgi:hypothetical protein
MKGKRQIKLNAAVASRTAKAASVRKERRKKAWRKQHDPS